MKNKAIVKLVGIATATVVGLSSTPPMTVFAAENETKMEAAATNDEAAETEKASQSETSDSTAKKEKKTKKTKKEKRTKVSAK